MIQKITCLLVVVFLAFGALLFSGNAAAQQLGIYEFTGHACATPATAVTTQPSGATFSDYTLTGAVCTAATGVYNSNTWTVGATLDPAKYFEFTITPNACTVMSLDSIQLQHRVSSSGGAVNIVVRSSQDGFTTDVYNAPISAVNSLVDLGIDLPASFDYLTSAVTFRTYVVNILSASATYRHDNVKLIGTATTYPLANYYQDADGDSYGNAAVFVNTCTPPAGYVASSADCDDNNNAIGAGLTFYQDSDNDGFGNPSVTQTACTQPVGYVANSNDCDDNNNAVGVATTVYYADADADGFGNPTVTQTACTQPVGYVSNSNDCDDNNNAVGVATTVYYVDADNDSYGDGGVTVIACSQPVGYVSNSNDCNDNDAAIHPGAAETCDGVDNDCFGGIDDNVTNLTWYADADTDGFGDPNVTQLDCAQPVGYVANSNDCDDNNNTVGVATTTFYLDADNDGFGDAANDSIACTQPAGYVLDNTDCDDSNNTITAPDNYYPDADSDGYGSALATPVSSCTPVAGHVLNNTDCDDNNVNINPAGTEIADNGIDEDCNGADLNTLGTQLAQYLFTTNDCTNGVSDMGVTTQPANAVFSEFSTVGTDCVMGVGYVNRANWNTGSTIDTTEYNQFTVIPADCYELELTQLSFLHRVSNSAGSPFVYVRSSLDNFTTDIFSTQFTVTGTNITETVTLPAAFASITDSVTFRFYVVGIATTGAAYRNDNVSVTGFINALPQQTFYADADGDGFGDLNSTVSDCEAPVGYVADNTDCNDNDANENPNAVWYIDGDSDGLGNSSTTLTQCTQPAGYVANADDCNDANNQIGAGTTYYQDADADGYGNPDSLMIGCTPLVGYVLNQNDCDDTDNQITIATNEFYVDADGDGYGSDALGVIACTAPAGYVDNMDDCDDTNTNITLGETFYEDADSDGFGNASSTTVACTAPAGYVADSTDCDDTNDAINPDGVDVSGNAIDENCDGVDGNLGLADNAVIQMSVSPNPGTDHVTVSIDAIWNNSLTVTLLTVDGKAAKTVTLKAVNGIVQIETTELLPSIYFIQVTDGVHTSVVRWVKN